MNLSDVFKASDAITVKRVFGEPYEKDGLTIIPAAMIGGGGGGGSGHDARNQEGEGGGFGLGGRPAGAYVVKNGQVSWQPAVDPNRIFTMIGLVLIAFLVTRPRVARARAKALAAKHGG
jgi:uncharacterized spore protein YtfJ